MSSNDQHSQSNFSEKLNKLELTLKEAGAVSRSIGKQMVAERTGWAQWVHLRMCIGARSIVVLAKQRLRNSIGKEQTLDQGSIASLARNAIETGAMLAYIADPSLNDEQWALRKQILWLHDATTRYRMFSKWKVEEEASGFREKVMELRARIESYKEFQELELARRQRILSGSEMYIHGLRSAVRLINWDIDDFDGTYAYLSAHSHCAPVAFMRTVEHGVDFLHPTDAQYDIAAMGLEGARIALATATQNIAELFNTRPSR